MDELTVREFAYQEPLAVFARFQHEPLALFLDSAQGDEQLGRYSFIARQPFQVLSSRTGQVSLGERTWADNPFDVLARELARFPLDSRAELPGFQTGVAGYFGYELGQHLEHLPRAPRPGPAFPDLLLGFYDCVLGFDTQARRSWVVSSGWPEATPARRRARAARRAAQFLGELLPPFELPPAEMPPAISAQSNFSAAEYQAAVQRVIEYILAGDIFQANLSQRFVAQLHSSDTPFALYRRLRHINPAPFAGYFNGGETVLASASPERFLQIQDGLVETRPIKGTRPRDPDPARDRELAASLLASAKDRAENTMIVDLLRNDLSRVCQPHSVTVPELCTLESFASVHHLVSTVTGRLQPDCTAIDLLKAAFPGGSVTGAPKIRAMQIITELEQTPRGPYCGALGYLNFSGDMDLNILIRTLAVHNGSAHFQAGGGIVADSDPAGEYTETLHKARLLLVALNAERA